MVKKKRVKKIFSSKRRQSALASCQGVMQITCKGEEREKLK